MKTFIPTSAALAALILGTAWPVPGQGGGGQGGAAFNKYDKVRTLMYTTSNSRESVPPVLIQFSPAQPDAMAMLREDLAVMSRLIERALEEGLGEAETPERMGIKMLLTGSGRSVRAMYVENLGPLFMIKVDFPLLAPPTVEKKPEPAGSSEWEMARKELRGTPDAEADAWIGRETAGAEFKEERVEALKKVLLATLKHAVNIRQLKPEECIVVSVFGTDGRAGGSRAGYGHNISTSGFGGGGHAEKNAGVAVAGPVASDVFSAPSSTSQPPSATPAPEKPASEARPSVQASSQPATSVGVSTGTRTVPIRMASNQTMGADREAGQGTVLTIRAKKSDVDALAKGELDLEAFKSRVMINTYTGHGQDITSVNSWIQLRSR
jgi:hypothetical protein